MSDADSPPFAGLKVLELAQGVGAPYCGMLLARNGARVDKIEPPSGDWSRGLGRAYGDLSADAIVAGRGKRSLVVDLKHPDGARVAAQLARDADVILQNYRPGVIERLGLDYQTVRRDNPAVVYASLTGFGAVGPRRDLPATDTVMQGYAGLMSINRDGAGVPRRLDMLAIDVATGLYLFQAVAAALYGRAVGGAGRHIVTSLLECALAFQEAKMTEFALSGGASGPVGAPVGTFATTDGFVSLNARRDKHFAALAALLGQPGWLTDPRFATAADRLAHAAVLNAEVAEAIAGRPTAYWSDQLTRADILHAPVHDYADLFDDPQVAALDALDWVSLEGLAPTPMVHLPGSRLAPDDPGRLPPHLGRQGRAVLSDLGLAPGEIDRLAASGAVAL